MKAKETQYKGYRFRSRLEARWAVFFDALGLTWKFEPEGFDLSDGTAYLPDFFISDVDSGIWIEVKPDNCTAQELAIAHAKARQLTFDTNIRTLVVEGDPLHMTDVPRFGLGGFSIFEPYDDNGSRVVGEDHPYVFCVCPWCEKVGLEYDGRGARVCGWKSHHKTEKEALDAIKHLGHWRADDKCYTYNHFKIVEAAISARSARFEHNQVGAPDQWKRG